MPEIIARWEWRTFGKGPFGEPEEKIKQHGEKGFKKSSEKYILSKTSNENVKIRDDLIDIKSLKQVNAQLEQWFPAMKQGFPAPKEQLAVLFRDFFKAPEPVFERDTYTFAQFLEELVAPCEGLCIVDVYKERHAFEINGATVEIAETTFNDVPMRTICAEHADPETVINTVRELGLAELPNINYINAMKSAVGMGAE